MSKRKTKNSVRVGCCFDELTRNDRDIIKNCILYYVEFTPVCRFITTATFFLFLDALFRIIAFIAAMQHLDVLSVKNYLYALSLIPYAAFSFTACLYACDIDKKRLLTSLISAIFAFLFLAAKYSIYGKLRLWLSEYPFISSFFWVQSLLFITAAVAIVLYLTHSKSLFAIADSIASHKEKF